MAAFLIRIEGCNFTATIYDTDNLSTIRGAALAYLRLAETWPDRLSAAGIANVETVAIGASDGIYRVETPDALPVIRAKIATAIAARPAGDDLDAVRPHLTFSAAVIVEGARYRDDVLRLVALCRAQQLQAPTVDVPPNPTGIKQPCAVDHVRPADVLCYRMPDGEKDVSTSVKARREYGRSARQEFYRAELGSQPDYDFANSFQELTAANPPGLSPVLEGKMAVVYLDGNKFTAIREKLVFGSQRADEPTKDIQDRQNAFSNFVRDARRQLLCAILGHIQEQPGMLYTPTRPKSEDQEQQRLKFETLLWGGDESLFVLPAWELMDLLPILAGELEKDYWLYRDSGYKLSHAVGVAICSIKTPIAVAKRHAEDVANEAKGLVSDPGIAKAEQQKKLRNVYSLQIFESIEPPRADLGAFREDLYGTKSVEAFTLTGAAGVRDMLEHIRKFQASPGGLPRSQLYKLINAAREKGFLSQRKVSEAEAFIGKELESGEKSETAVQLALVRSGSNLKVCDFRSPLLGYTIEAPLLPLLRLAELWDYVDPLGPPPPGVAP